MSLSCTVFRYSEILVENRRFEIFGAPNNESKTRVPIDECRPTGNNVGPYRIAVTIHTVLDRSVTNSRWQLGAILETSSKDVCLKTYINILKLIFAIFTARICIIS